ncbi:universal stress protein [Prosthecochloris sp.]|uniref:universal stress protein n=1 Tax=Prosthecochloris sp. TaxID=290513 RepID=UPI0025CBE87E|nr:universal stress protein [Prosthecochloris sp.]
MTGVAKSITIKRITVAIDCSPHSRASLFAAAEIAGMLQAELLGVFVEDINLIRMAELPFSQEIHLHTARSEPLDSLKLERLLKLQAKEAHELFIQTAERFGIPYRFRKLRGMVPTEVLEAALGTDLLAMGRSGRAPVCCRGLGSTARKAIREAKTNILLTRPGLEADSPLLVIYDGSTGAKAALETAIGFVREDASLHVFLLGNNVRKHAFLKDEVEMILGTRITKKEFHVIPWTDSRMIAQCIHMIEPGLLVLSDTPKTISTETVYNLIDTIDYPVLLVKSPG